jgi:hypothetical protein
MKRESRQRPGVVGIGFLLLLFALNYAWASVTGYPVIYCALSNLAPLIAPLWHWLFLLGLAVFVWTLFSGKNWGGAALMFFLLGGLPVFLGTLFLSGLGCWP